MPNVTPNLGLPLETNGMIGFEQSIVRSMAILSAQLGLTIKVDPVGMEALRRSYKLAMLKLSVALNISLPAVAAVDAGISSFKDHYIAAMKVIDTNGVAPPLPVSITGPLISNPVAQPVGPTTIAIGSISLLDAGVDHFFEFTLNPENNVNMTLTVHDTGSTHMDARIESGQGSGTFYTFNDGSVAGNANFTMVPGDVIRVEVSHGETFYIKKNGVAFVTRQLAHVAGATKMSINSFSGTTTISYGALADPISITSPDRTADNRFKATLLYGNRVSAPPLGYQMQIETPTGAVVSPWADLIMKTNPTAGIVTVESAAALPLGDSVVRVRRTDLTSATAQAAIYRPAMPFSLGMNEGYIDTGAGPRDLYARARISAGFTNRQILPRDGFLLASDAGGYCLTSADGAGDTVRADRDGRLYATNGVGATFYSIRLDHHDIANRLSFTFTMAPGVIATNGGEGFSNYVYDSVTGQGSFTLLPNDGSLRRIIAIECSSIPSGGVRPTFTAVGDANPSRAYTDEAAANFVSSKGFTRWMTPLGINNARVAGWTPTTLGLRSAGKVWSGWQDGVTTAMVVGAVTQIGGHLWFNQAHLDDDSRMMEDAVYVRDHLPADRKVIIELGNENPWNGFNGQSPEIMLEGLRRGYGVVSLTSPTTPTAAVEETIINCDSGQSGTQWVDPGAGVTQHAFNAGDKIYANLYGYGMTVWQARSNQPSGSVLPPPTAVGVQNAGWTVLYTNVQAVLAGQRWLMTNTKRMRQIWDTAFAVTGRARAIPAIGFGISLGAGTWAPVLDWDNGAAGMSGGVFAVAPYIAGMGSTNMWDYNNNDTPGFTNADKALLYGTNGVQVVADKFFAANLAGEATLQSKLDECVTAHKWLRDYLSAKGLARDSIAFGVYEFNWEVNFRNWPDDTLSSQLRRRITHDDPRFAALIAKWCSGWAKGIGGPMVVFDRTTGIVSVNGGSSGFSWGVMNSEQDNILTGGAGTNYWLKGYKDVEASL